MATYLWVGIGGMVGAYARYAVVNAVARGTGLQFPWGTLLVNLTGSFAIGVVATLIFVRGFDPAWGFFLVTGLLGGYTTFSAFSLELVHFIDSQRVGEAALYAFGAPMLGFGACWFGSWLVRSLFG